MLACSNENEEIALELLKFPHRQHLYLVLKTEEAILSVLKLEAMYGRPRVVEALLALDDDRLLEVGLEDGLNALDIAIDERLRDIVELLLLDRRADRLLGLAKDGGVAVLNRTLSHETDDIAAAVSQRVFELNALAKKT